jgi:hypothetical protein
LTARILYSLGLLTCLACAAGDSTDVASASPQRIRDCHPLPDLDAAVETLTTATTFSVGIGWGLVPSDTYLAFLQVCAQPDAADYLLAMCDDPRLTAAGFLYSRCGLILLDPSLDGQCRSRTEWFQQDVRFQRGCVVTTSSFRDAYTQMDALANELLRGKLEFDREHEWPPNNPLQRTGASRPPLNG